MTMYVHHGDEGQRTCLLVQRGRRWLHVIFACGTGPGGSLRINKLPLTEERNMRPELHAGQPYPLERAREVLRDRAARCGATTAAMRHL